MVRWLIAAADFVTTGGMEIANWHLANHLARTDPVELVTHRVDSILAGSSNVRVIRVPRPFGMNMLGEPLLRRKALARSRLILAEGGRVIANGGNCPAADVNWVHYVHAAFEPVTAGSRIRRVKTRCYHRACLRAERQAFEQARIIICNSRLTAGHVERLGISAGKIKVVYLGSDPEALKPITREDRAATRADFGWSEAPTAAFVGALGDRRKGFDVLYAAWQTLCREATWDANLVVMGRGAELPVWKQRARADGLAHRIQFLGYRNDVPRVLAGCDVLVHPARYEAYGLGVHEAVARGLPAIVSAGSGVAERLDGPLQDLLVANPEDHRALADKLRHWRANLEHYRAVSGPVAERLRRHSWSDMAREFVEVVNSECPH